MKTLSILIPVYNEKYTVEEVIDEVSRVALPDGMGREVIVIDDASTDGTSGILDRLAGSRPGLKVIHHEKNQGKGAAIRTGVRHVTGDVVVVQDADLEYSPSDYGRLLKPILDGHADVVFGSRFMPSEATRVLYFWHSVGNRFLTLCSNMLTDLNLTDMETCFKMARAEIMKSIPIRSERFGIEPELTAKYAKRGCRIYEVPVSYRGRTYQEGKKITWKDGIKAFGVMVWFKVVDDLFAADYGDERIRSLLGTHRFHAWMADLLRPWVGERVVELGAGMGDVSRRLMPCESYAITDRNPDQLAYLKDMFGLNRRVVIASVDPSKREDIDRCPPGPDTIICIHELERAEDDALAVRNMFGTLTPGGRVCVVAAQGRGLMSPLDQALGFRRRYDRAGLEALLVSAGFKVEKAISFNRLATLVWWFNGRVLGRSRVGRFQLKVLDTFLWLRRLLDPVLPCTGLSLLVVGRKS